MSDDLIAEIRALRAEVAVIRGMLEARAAPRVDDAATTRLLETIFAVVGEYGFQTGDLFDRVHPASNAALRAAIIAACGEVSSKRVGQLLRRCDGRNVGGYVVSRVPGANVRDGIMWMVTRAQS